MLSTYQPLPAEMIEGFMTAIEYDDPYSDWQDPIVERRGSSIESYSTLLRGLGFEQHQIDEGFVVAGNRFIQKELREGM